MLIEEFLVITVRDENEEGECYTAYVHGRVPNMTVVADSLPDCFIKLGNLLKLAEKEKEKEEKEINESISWPKADTNPGSMPF